MDIKFPGLQKLLDTKVEPNSETIIVDEPEYKMKIIGDKDGNPTVIGWSMEHFTWWRNRK